MINRWCRGINLRGRARRDDLWHSGDVLLNNGVTTEEGLLLPISEVELGDYVLAYHEG